MFNNSEGGITMGNGRFGPLIGAIDEGTSSARFLIFAANTGEVLTYHQVHIEQHCQQEGWVDQDPLMILSAVKECVDKAIDNLRKLDIDPADIKAVGITNQRESTIVWDPKTGLPLYNAILWLDVRTSTTVDQVLRKVRGNQDCLKSLCGLPVSTYFSALKVRWMIDNVPAVRTAVVNKTCYFGTIDTWLIWNLTGGKHGGIHITDVTNASRTMLMNIKTLKWDKMLCRFFDIPIEILPDIRSSSEIYGCIVDGPLQGIPISGCLGDQQSALVGQLCFKQGQAKNTLGTGSFMLYNTGTVAIQSNHGLLTTVAYKMGKAAPPIYALEGSIAICGVVIQWLRDNLNVLDTATDSESFALKATRDGEVYFVPAFAGLYAPYWRKDARSCICGITEETTKYHIVKAALEAVCFQTRDVLQAMGSDCGIPVTRILVDGGMTANDYLMQLLADLCGTEVVRPLMTETTSLGAAIAAGCAEGIAVWDLEHTHTTPCDIFKPSISDNARDLKYSMWKKAIKKSFGWVPDNGSARKAESDKMWSVLSSLPGSLFIVTIFGLIMLARRLKN